MAGRYWTKEEEEFLKHINYQYTMKEICEKLDRTEYSIKRKLSSLKIKGVKRNQTKFFNKYTINENFFNTINFDNAYILGFMFADGHLQKNGNGFEIYQKDKTILEDIQQKMNSNHKIFLHKISKVHTLSIQRQKMNKDLQKIIPMGKKSDIIKIPKMNFNLMSHFVRGYFDGDGCVYKQKNLVCKMNSTSKKMLLNIQNYLSHEFIDSKLKKLYNRKYDDKYKREIIFELNMYKKESVFKFYNLIYKNADIFIKRKKNIFDEFYNNYI